MAVQIPPGFAQITIPLRNVALSRPAAVVFGVDVGLSGDASTLADGVQSIWHQHMDTQMDSGVVVGPTIARVGTASGEAIVGEASSATSGLVDGATPPPNVAVLCKKSTERSGRRGRGRMFVPWWCPESAIDEAGVISGAALADLNTTWNDFLGELVISGYQMVILHDVSPGQSTLPGAPTPVTAGVVDPRVSSMKKRLGRR